MTLFARRFDTAEPVCVEVAQGQITRIEPASPAAGPWGDWPWIAPGLIDLQINGYGGQEFNAPDITPERVAAIVRAMTRYGVTRVCPTVTTESFDALRHALAVIHTACEASPALAHQVAAIHLEGPYISPEDGYRGAHPRAHCRAPDWEEFQRLQEAAGGRIRILTMAVEYPGAPQFIARVAATGVVVAIGHTAAETAQIRAAVDAGARLSTHLGNGSHPVIRRHPNYIWAQLADDRLMASMIVDGHHLPAEVVQSFVRAKGLQRCILVSDLSGLAGLAPGRYPSRLCDVEILPEGRLVVAGQREILAGAGLPLSVGIGNVMQFAGIELGAAIALATTHPAELLGLDPPRLEPGARADLVLFDLAAGPDAAAPRRFQPRTVLVRGEPTS